MFHQNNRGLTPLAAAEGLWLLKEAEGALGAQGGRHNDLLWV